MADVVFVASVRRDKGFDAPRREFRAFEPPCGQHVFVLSGPYGFLEQVLCDLIISRGVCCQDERWNFSHCDAAGRVGHFPRSCNCRPVPKLSHKAWNRAEEEEGGMEREREKEREMERREKIW
jgi:hypothetical protein